MKNSKKNPSKKSNDPLAGDLSGLFDMATQWKHMSFELRPKNRTISLRLNSDLLEELKKEAEKLGIDYQKFIRIALEGYIYKKAA
jgi:predicted DNA binding CopG/RHH family protein